MAINPSQFQKLNVTDTCAIWNILSSKLLYITAIKANCYFCCTKFVHYECLHKPRKKYKNEDINLQGNLKQAMQEGQFKTYHLDIEDLQQVAVLQKRKNLGKGELSSIVYAKKTCQAFLTDDRKARELAENIIYRQNVQTTPHLLGWLFFANYLGDSDLKLIIDQHKQNKQPLEKYFTEMYFRALDYRSKQNINNSKVAIDTPRSLEKD